MFTVWEFVFGTFEMNGVSFLPGLSQGDLCLYDQTSAGAQKLKLAQAGLWNRWVGVSTVIEDNLWIAIFSKK